MMPSLVTYLDGPPGVHVRQLNFQVQVQSWPSLLLGCSAAAKESREDVMGVVSSTLLSSFVLLESLLPMPVIYLSRLWKLSCQTSHGDPNEPHLLLRQDLIG